MNTTNCADRAAAVLFLLFLGCALTAQTSMAHAAGIIPGQHIVVLKDGAEAPGVIANDMKARHGVAPRHIYSHALRGFSAAIPDARLDAVRNDPRVAYVEPDIEVTAIAATGAAKGLATPSTPPAQIVPTGINRIDADLSGTAKINGIDERVNVDVAIIDTGINKTHPDLNVVQGVTITGSGASGGEDDNGHGTHVAGTAAAIDNGSGVVGVAPGARLWAVKVLDRRGSGAMSRVIAGIDWVTARAAAIEVANLSLGATGKSDALRLALQNSVAAGIFYAVAAGNEGKDVYGADGIFNTLDDAIPAAYPEVAAVSALADSDGNGGGLGGATSWGNDDTLASFSNYSRSVAPGNPVNSAGAAIDIAAPGVNIRSTWLKGGYNTISGTSMASPHVAGAAALYIAVNGKPLNAAGVAAVRQALIDAGSVQSGPLGFSGDKDFNPEPVLNVGTF